MKGTMLCRTHWICYVMLCHHMRQILSCTGNDTPLPLTSIVSRWGRRVVSAQWCLRLKGTAEGRCPGESMQRDQSGFTQVNYLHNWTDSTVQLINKWNERVNKYIKLLARRIADSTHSLAQLGRQKLIWEQGRPQQNIHDVASPLINWNPCKRDTDTFLCSIISEQPYSEL